MSLIGSDRARRAHGRREQKPRLKADCPAVRDVETIDAEIQLLVQARCLVWALSNRKSITAVIDELLDERSATVARTATIEIRPFDGPLHGLARDRTPVIDPKEPVMHSESQLRRRARAEGLTRHCHVD